MTCKHSHLKTGPDRCFSGPVRVTDQNPAAHGNVTYTETCTDCGAERSVNVNQCHVEEGEWSGAAPAAAASWMEVYYGEHRR